ncbi:MAG: type toxin-antitoxin system HicB family antitoxin [Dehalococcoidia bacterium]|nr:type toxin-antitoxin system HicB family antitoxin [Dehalococcoidia bacterium]
METREYLVIVHKAEEGGYWTDVPTLPGAGSQGDTIEEAIEMTLESITLVLEVLKEDGKPIPFDTDKVVKVSVLV